MSPAPSADRRAERVLPGAGDRSARYERLVTDHAAAILRYLHGVVGSSQAAEDLAQETYLRAWQHLDRLRAPDRARSWLFAIAANTARRHLRRRGRFGWLPIEGLSGSAARAIELDGLDAGGLALERALGALGEADRQLVLLVGLEGFTIAEAAEVLGVSPAAGKKRWQRACARVRAALDEAGHGAGGAAGLSSEAGSRTGTGTKSGSGSTRS